jgi:hypothetical protein
MQNEGGYRYPGNAICLLSSIIVLLTIGWLWNANHLSTQKALALVFGTEGTILWASAFTPKGLLPPQGGIWARVQWLFKVQGGTSLSFNQPMFYIGILFVLAACFLGVVAG